MRRIAGRSSGFFLRRTAFLWSATKEVPFGRIFAQIARMSWGKILSLIMVAGLAGPGAGGGGEAVGRGGGLVYEHESTVPLVPASNQKLIVSAAAMGLLPADFAYRT